MTSDCHIHIILDGIDYKQAVSIHQDSIKEDIVRKRLAQYREQGITFLRDGGDAHMVSLLAKKLAPEYGIDYRTPVFAIYKKGTYGEKFGFSYSNLSEYRALIKQIKQLGGDFIKLMISGIMDFQQAGRITGEPLPGEEIKSLIEIAKEASFAVMAHANGRAAILPALEASVDSIEHGYYMDEECLQALSKSQTVWVPTLAPVANLVGSGRFLDQTLLNILNLQKKNIQIAEKNASFLGIGSDAGSYLVPHETAKRREFTLLEEVLKTPKETLTRGTQRIQVLFR